MKKPIPTILRWSGAALAVTCATASLFQGGIGILGAIVLLAAAFMISPLSKSISFFESHNITAIIGAIVLWVAGITMLGYSTPETVDENTRSIPVSSDTETMDTASSLVSDNTKTKSSQAEKVFDTTKSADTNNSVAESRLKHRQLLFLSHQHRKRPKSKNTS